MLVKTALNSSLAAAHRDISSSSCADIADHQSLTGHVDVQVDVVAKSEYCPLFGAAGRAQVNAARNQIRFGVEARKRCENKRRGQNLIFEGLNHMSSCSFWKILCFSNCDACRPSLPDTHSNFPEC